MSWSRTISPAEFWFPQLTKAEFANLVAKVKAIPNIEGVHDGAALTIRKTAQTITYAGSFNRGGKDELESFFALMAQHLKPVVDDYDDPDFIYYIDTYSDQEEPSYLATDTEHIRYVVSPGYVTEERIYVAAPHTIYAMPVLKPRTPEQRENWGGSDEDLARCLEGLRQRVEYVEREIASRATRTAKV